MSHGEPWKLCRRLQWPSLRLTLRLLLSVLLSDVTVWGVGGISVVRAGEGCFYTTTELRGWAIIVEGGNSGSLPVCVQQRTYYRHSDGNAVLYCTHLGL